MEIINLKIPKTKYTKKTEKNLLFIGNKIARILCMEYGFVGEATIKLSKKLKKNENNKCNE